MCTAFFAECIVRSPGLIIGNAQYVKKVVFPLEILPWVTVFSALFSYCYQCGGAGGVLFARQCHIELDDCFRFPSYCFPSWYWRPVWRGDCLRWRVYVRDVSHVVGVIATVLLFTSPIFYPIEAMPEFVRPIIYLNPLSFIVEQLREVGIWGPITQFSWPKYLSTSWCCCSVGGVTLVS